MRFPKQNYEKQLDCVLIVTRYKVKKCRARQLTCAQWSRKYFSRNLSKVSICLNKHRWDLMFPPGISAEDHFSTIQTIDLISFSFLQASVFWGCQVGDYFAHQVASTKILVAMMPIVVATWRITLGVSRDIFSACSNGYSCYKKLWLTDIFTQRTH